MKQLSDPAKRIVVEMVGASDRPKGPPGPKGLRAQRASIPKGPPGPKGSRPGGPEAQRTPRPEGPPGHFAVLARALPF